MKEDLSLLFREIITEKKGTQNDFNINSIGYLYVIGYEPKRIIQGKKLFRKIIGYIDNNNLLDKYSEKDIDTFIFDKLMLNVSRQSWKYKNIYSHNPKKEDGTITSEFNNKNKHVRSALFNSVEYSVILRKSEEEMPSKADSELSLLINDFNIWLNDYLKIFLTSNINISDIKTLLKIIVSK